MFAGIYSQGTGPRVTLGASPFSAQRGPGSVERSHDIAQVRRAIIDLFAGVGGLSLGAARAGFDVVAAVDADRRALDTHARNFPASRHLHISIDDQLSGEELLRMAGLKRGTLGGLVGGPPCQGFSVIGHRAEGDKRNHLFCEFFRLVAETSPLFYIAENVPGILDDRYSSLLNGALAQVADSYHLLPPLSLTATDFGAPTQRTRIFFVGYRAGELGDLSEDDFSPPKVPAPNVRQALAGLPVEIQGTGLDALSIDSLEPDVDSPRHFVEHLSQKIPDGVGDQATVALLTKEGLVTGCTGTAHCEDVVDRFARTPPGSREKISRYPRLDPEGYCPTLRAGTDEERGSFQAVRPVHHSEPRVITPREAARLQGFPDWFVFHHTKWHAFRQIGNSVSPLVAEFVLSVIYSQLGQQRHSRTDSLDGNSPKDGFAGSDQRSAELVSA